MIDIKQEFEEIHEMKSEIDRRIVLLRERKTGKFFVYKTFDREVVAYKEIWQLSHECLPEITWMEINQGKTHLLEEYISGRNMAEVLREEGHIKEDAAISFLQQLCGVLKLLHSKELIHRDIKPSNIIIKDTGAIKLIDFDIARVVKEESGNDTTYLGTKGYAPPEQYGFAQTDKRTDIYSMGVTAKELIGEEYKGKLSPIIDKCIAIDPARRFQSALEVEKAIESALHPGRKQVKRIFIAIIAISVLGIILAGVNYYLDNLAGNNRTLSAEEIFLGYAVNQSEQDAPGQFFGVGEGELMFQDDIPFEERYIGTANIRYITYTTPLSFVKFEITNNGTIPIKSAMMDFNFTDVTLFKGEGKYKNLELTNHVHGIGDYAEVIWTSEDDIRPGETRKFEIPMQQSAVFSDKASVNVTFMADNAESILFTLPIKVKGGFEINREPKQTAIVPTDTETKKETEKEKYGWSDVCFSYFGKTVDELEKLVGPFVDSGMYKGGQYYSAEGTKEQGRTVFYVDANEQCIGVNARMKRWITGIDKTLTKAEVDELMGFESSLSENNDSEGYGLFFEDKINGQTFSAAFYCDDKGNVSPEDYVEVVVKDY